MNLNIKKRSLLIYLFIYLLETKGQGWRKEGQGPKRRNSPLSRLSVHRYEIMDVCPVLLRSYTVPCCNACEGVVAPSSSPLQIHPPSLELLYHPPPTPAPTWGWALYLAILKAFSFHTWGSVTRLSVVQPFDHFSLVTPIIDCSAHPVNVSIFIFYF